MARGLTAQRIWQDLRAEYGFGASYSSVKRLVRGIKQAHPEVADVLEHPPGEEVQVDFFHGPPTLDPERGQWRRPWVLRMVLSCSRHSYEEPLWKQDHVSFLRAQENAFLDFGGVPRTVRLDNLKAGVARACLYDPDITELYAAFARHWGFVPLPCRPRHPQEQGVVERGGDYLKDNAFKGRRFDGLSAGRRKPKAKKTRRSEMLSQMMACSAKVAGSTRSPSGLPWTQPTSAGVSTALNCLQRPVAGASPVACPAPRPLVTAQRRLPGTAPVNS